MQVLKEEIREKIFQVAAQEFKAKGFKNSSMRNIAENCGITVGNLYRYFKNKEDLFYSIVSPAYEKIMFSIKESIKLKSSNKDIVLMDCMADNIIESHIEKMDSLLILFNGSEGTKYENIKEEIVAIFEGFLNNISLHKLKEQGIIIEDVFLLHVIAADFIEGILMILRHYEDEVKMKKVVSQFIRFYFKGRVK